MGRHPVKPFSHKQIIESYPLVLIFEMATVEGFSGQERLSAADPPFLTSISLRPREMLSTPDFLY